MTHFFTSLNKALQMFAIFVQCYKGFRVFSGAEYFYNQLKQSHHYFFSPPQAVPLLLPKQEEDYTLATTKKSAPLGWVQEELPERVRR